MLTGGLRPPGALLEADRGARAAGHRRHGARHVRDHRGGGVGRGKIGVDTPRKITTALALFKHHAGVFTAGVGENDPIVRARSLDGLEPLGIRVAEDRNLVASADARAISPPDAAVSVLVVPTDEELEMAEQAAALVR